MVSDISTLPFEAAEKLGIPSIGISNFTWYTAYHDLIDELDLKPFKEAYCKMRYFFSLAGSNETWDIKSKNFGFLSREVDIQEVRRIKKLVDPSQSKKIIFLGLGMKIDVDSLEQLPIWDSINCVFVVSSNVQVNRSNVFQIPTDYLESQNYIAASDLVISKAGWGMVGEAISANVPLLILNRPSMKEDQNTINYLKKYHFCETIDWGDLKSYNVDISIINRLQEDKKGIPYNHNNQSEKIVKDLMEILRND